MNLSFNDKLGIALAALSSTSGWAYSLLKQSTTVRHLTISAFVGTLVYTCLVIFDKGIEPMSDEQKSQTTGIVMEGNGTVISNRIRAEGFDKGAVFKGNDSVEANDATVIAPKKK